MKKLVQRDKRGYLEELASTAKEAASHHQHGTAYKIINLICGENFENFETSNTSIAKKDNYSPLKKNKEIDGQSTSERFSTEIPLYTQ